ncbi:MAG TPA: serine hydrolase domain-containing protein [Chitinophagaceae bacterium]|nr:serine hydrolase domain-containing protein [Chitinophagaceae bacterium]
MRTTNLFILSIFSILLITSCSKSNTEEPPKEKQNDIAVVDNAVQKWMSDNTMPGLTLAVSKNGKLVYSKGYGLADKETSEKVTPETKFRIASVSKLLTSVAIMKLVETGKISMNQKVFGDGSILGTEYGTKPYKQYVTDITVAHLLRHTTGGWGQANDPAFLDYNMKAGEVINYTLQNQLLTKAPGSSADYSNFGYMLLARIIEKASGKKYAAYVYDEILSKVGATNTSIAGTSLTGRQVKEAKYYGQGGETSFVYDNMNFERAEGAFGWISTAPDLLRFTTAVDSSSTRPDILSLQTIKEMVTTTPASLWQGFHFGCGWVIENNEWFWWGSLPGTFAILYRNGNGICIAAMANSRRQPDPNNGLYSFIPIINQIAFDATIPWQDIDQF